MRKSVQAYAHEQADSYSGFEGGHTGNFTNVMWRALCIPNVPVEKQHHYRRHQEKLRWYCELCRMPGGGFKMLPTFKGNPRYATEEWGVTVGLSLTGGLKTLSMTGASRTKYSVGPSTRVVLWKNSDFFKLDHAEGYDVMKFQGELSKITGKCRGPRGGRISPTRA